MDPDLSPRSGSSLPGPTTEAPDEPSDEELIARVRAGDSESYGILFARHRDAAYRLARQISRNPAEADDLVSEAFLKVRGTLDSGGGPDAAFRAYLLTTVRRLAYDRTRQGRRVVSTADYAGLDTAVPFEDTAASALEADLVTEAYQSLPERWQLVLWYRVVEGRSTEDVARLMGTSPNAVAALVYRAREGLRERYLQAHVTHRPEDVGCDWTIERLAGYARGGLSRRDSDRVADHLRSCARCRALYDEVRDVNATLAAALAPAALAATAVAGSTLATAASATTAASAATVTAGTTAHAGGSAAGVPAAKGVLVLGLLLGGVLTVATGGTLYLLSADEPAPEAEAAGTHAVLSSQDLARMGAACFTEPTQPTAAGLGGSSETFPVPGPDDDGVALGPDGTTVLVAKEAEETTVLVDVTAARLSAAPCVLVSSPPGTHFLAFGSAVDRPWTCASQGPTVACRPQGDWWTAADPDPDEESEVLVRNQNSETDDRSLAVYVLNQSEQGYLVEPILP